MVSTTLSFTLFMIGFSAKNGGSELEFKIGIPDPPD